MRWRHRRAHPVDYTPERRAAVAAFLAASEPSAMTGTQRLALVLGALVGVDDGAGLVFTVEDVATALGDDRARAYAVELLDEAGW